jgi:Outer membrane protein beta-barrel domain
MVRRTGVAVAAFFLFASIAWAQDNKYEVSLGGSAVFNMQSTGNGTVLTPTNSGAFLISGGYRFSEHSSVEINYSHTTNSQIYFASPLTYRIQGTISEYSGAYVFSFHQSKKLQPFVFAGAAALVFYPSYSLNTINGVQTYIPASQQTRPTFLYGAGFDYAVFSRVPIVRRFSLVDHVALRLQYRGLVYKAPDFKVQNLFTGDRGHMAEPSAGIVVKF